MGSKMKEKEKMLKGEKEKEKKKEEMWKSEEEKEKKEEMWKGEEEEKDKAEKEKRGDVGGAEEKMRTKVEWNFDKEKSALERPKPRHQHFVKEQTRQA